MHRHHVLSVRRSKFLLHSVRGANLSLLISVKILLAVNGAKVGTERDKMPLVLVELGLETI